MAIPTLNTLSLFSGYGGLELGLMLAGEVCSFETRTVCYVEREAFAAANLVSKMAAGQLDQAPIWSDVTTFDPEPWRGRVDLITNGFPCQPFSTAGKKQRGNDERWLWEDIERVVQPLRPRFMFLENSPEIVKGKEFDAILETLAFLGLDAEWDVFSGKELGLKQKRRRWFLLAFPIRNRGRKIWSNIHHPSDREKSGLPGAAGKSALLARRGSRKSNWLSRKQREEGTSLGGTCPPWGSPAPPGPDEDWRSYSDRVCRTFTRTSYEVDRYRLCGNGVVPVVAGYAFCTLARRAGLVTL